MREGRLQKYVRRAGGAEQLLHFGSKVTKEIEIKISFSQQVNQYRILLDPPMMTACTRRTSAPIFGIRKDMRIPWIIF